MATKKNKAAVVMGQMRWENLSRTERASIARAGGKKRAEVLSPEERSAIARKAVAARWSKTK